MGDDHWPSLPPIRTSSYNARVSCETLNNLPSSPSASRRLHTPCSSSTTKDAFKSIETTPPSTSCSTPQPHPFSHCFPHRFSTPKQTACRGHDSKRPTAGTFDPTGLLRSFCGFPAAAIPRYSSPLVPFSSGVSPSHRPAPSSATNSPSGRMRSGGTTPVMRSSKGHTAHVFTMMPPDVVGKKKHPDYEADEPTSPEVTCMGRVRRKKPGKAAKDKHRDVKKRGKVKKPAVEVTHKAGFVQVKRSEATEDKPTMSAKLSKQRSVRRQLFEVEGFLSQGINVHMPRPELVDSAWNDGTTSSLPLDCLLLMKKGSKHNA